MHRLRRDAGVSDRQRPALLLLLKELRDELFEEAEDILSDAVDEGAKWSVLIVLKTAGASLGYGKFPVKPIEPLRPAPPAIDLNKLQEEDRKRYRFLEAVSHGYRDGVMRPEPEFVQRLDREIEAVRAAFAETRGRVVKAACILGISVDQLQEYLARRPDLEWAISNRVEALVYRAEAALRKAVRAKERWAIEFTIKTMGRWKGYSENSRDEIPKPKKEIKDGPDYKRLNTDELIEFDMLQDRARGIEPFDPWAKLGMKMPPYNDKPRRLD